MCGGKIFKPNWVGLSVGKVRSVCVKLQRNCLPFFGRLLVVGSVVLRLLVTVYVLAMVGHLKNVCPTLAQMPNKITNVEFKTVSPTIANTMLAVRCFSFKVL